jgi:hypothetical protein
MTGYETPDNLYEDVLKLKVTDSASEYHAAAPEGLCVSRYVGQCDTFSAF